MYPAPPVIKIMRPPSQVLPSADGFVHGFEAPVRRQNHVVLDGRGWIVRRVQLRLPAGMCSSSAALKVGLNDV
jgi:hypothetical protein